jgi:hypothetical protein
MTCADCRAPIPDHPRIKRCDTCRRERKLQQQRAAMRASRAYIAYRQMRRAA